MPQRNWLIKKLSNIADVRVSSDNPRIRSSSRTGRYRLVWAMIIQRFKLPSPVVRVYGQLGQPLDC